MPEIKTPIKKLKEGQTYTAGSDDYLITEDHTFADIVRFLLKQGCSKEEMHLLAEMEEES